MMGRIINREEERKRMGWPKKGTEEEEKKARGTKKEVKCRRSNKARKREKIGTR